MSNSFRPHGLQHFRLPCPSPTPGACSNSCPSSEWCHPTISSSVIPFSSCLQSFPAPGSFQMSHCSHQVAEVLEFQLQHQSFQRTPRTDLLLQNGLVGSPCSPRDSQESSPTPQFESSNSLVLSFHYNLIWILIFIFCPLSFLLVGIWAMEFALRVTCKRTIKTRVGGEKIKTKPKNSDLDEEAKVIVFNIS